MNHRRKLTLQACFLVPFSQAIRYVFYRQHNPYRNNPPYYHKFAGLIALKAHRTPLILPAFLHKE